MRAALLSTLLTVAFASPLAAAAPAPTRKPAGEQLADGNRPERLEWFRDLGFGMFIHWSVDSQIGSVISHSLVGADERYRKRFFEDLPKSFDPRKYHPRDWAVLAKLAGMKYVVFTTKHHSGFCMYDTKTTDYSIMKTPYAKDVFGELVKALREQGLAVGVYFSPDDFHYLHRVGKLIDRDPGDALRHLRPGLMPQDDPKFMEFTKAQIRELMTSYGPIDVVFIDGRADGIRDLIWQINPDTVVSRGAILTPEQRIPGVPLDQPWESCITMGTQWHYKPTHETYKSGTQLVEMLIETRAKGGNLLLNVGPKPDGELPIEQEERLREFALWNMAFGESLDGVRPWVVSNEGDVWFTKKKNEDTVYAILTKVGSWPLGDRRKVTLRSVKASAKTTVQVLSQTGEALEYRPDVDAKPKWKQTEAGLELDVMMAQRLYNDRKWPDPVAVKITHVTPGLRPPAVESASSTRTGARATLRGVLKDLGQAPSVEVGFEYRRRKRAEELYEKDEAWKPTPLVKRTATGEFSAEIDGLVEGETYEFRALVQHPLMTIRGAEMEAAGR